MFKIKSFTKSLFNNLYQTYTIKYLLKEILKHFLTSQKYIHRFIENKKLVLERFHGNISILHSLFTYNCNFFMFRFRNYILSNIFASI